MLSNVLAFCGVTKLEIPALSEREALHDIASPKKQALILAANDAVAKRKRVILIGAGHAHLYAIKRAGAFVQRGYEFTVIAPGAFWYSGLATGMLGGIYPPADDRVNIQALLGANGVLIKDVLVGLNAKARSVNVNQSGAMEFDALSLNLGSEVPSIPGAGQDCYSVKPIRRLYELRCDLERRFAAKPGRKVRIAIAGGGITAFEIGANTIELARRRRGQVSVSIYAGDPEPLKQLPRRAANTVVRGLTSRRADIQSLRVEHIEDHQILLSDESTADFDIFVNATGLQPPSIIRSLGLLLAENGALITDEHLQVIGSPGIYAGGDCIAFRGSPLPRIGVYAVRQGPILFSNLLATLAGKPLQEFRPQSKYLAIMTLGGGRGLAVRDSAWWYGRSAFWLKDWIDRRFVQEYQAASSR